MKNQHPAFVNYEALDRDYMTNMLDILSILRQELGVLRLIANSKEYGLPLTDLAKELVPEIITEMGYLKGEIAYERRLKELES